MRIAPEPRATVVAPRRRHVCRSSGMTAYASCCLYPTRTFGWPSALAMGSGLQRESQHQQRGGPPSYAPTALRSADGSDSKIHKERERAGAPGSSSMRRVGTEQAPRHPRCARAGARPDGAWPASRRCGRGLFACIASGTGLRADPSHAKGCARELASATLTLPVGEKRSPSPGPQQRPPCSCLPLGPIRACLLCLIGRAEPAGLPPSGTEGGVVALLCRPA